MREGRKRDQLLDALKPQLPLERHLLHAGDDDALRHRPGALEVQESRDLEEERVGVADGSTLSAASETLGGRGE